MLQCAKFAEIAEKSSFLQPVSYIVLHWAMSRNGDARNGDVTQWRCHAMAMHDKKLEQLHSATAQISSKGKTRGLRVLLRQQQQQQ